MRFFLNLNGLFTFCGDKHPIWINFGPCCVVFGVDAMKFLRRLPFALTVACIYSGAIAILILAAPKWQLDRLLLDLRIGDYLPIFAPPLSRDAVGLLAFVTTTLVGCILYMGLSRMRPSKRGSGLELPTMPSRGLLDQLPPRMPPRILPPRQIRPAPLHRQSRQDVAAQADEGLMLHLEPAPVKPPE